MVENDKLRSPQAACLCDLAAWFTMNSSMGGMGDACRDFAHQRRLPRTRENVEAVARVAEAYYGATW